MMDEHLNQLCDMYIEDFKQQRLNCAEAVLMTMCDYYDLNTSVCPMIATAFGGGMCATQGACGALSGALMVIGLRHGRELGGDKAPSYALGKQLIEWARNRYGDVNCLGISGCDFKDPAQMAGFRMPGGAHERVCEGLVRDVCGWLCDNL